MITFVNLFQVRGSVEEFERVFAETSEFMAAQQGFRQHTLARNIEEDKADCYVNIAHWRDAECLRRAIAHPDFLAHAEQIRALSTSTANLYVPRQSRSER